MAEAVSRRRQIKELWPDKALFGSILLFITALLGLLYGLADLLFPISISENVPAVLRDFPPVATTILSGVGAVLAYLSLKFWRFELALWGSLAAFFSFALIGVGSVLALIAFGFMMWSRAEGEHENPETAKLTPGEWPDKALAASVVMCVAAVVTLLWGVGLLAGLAGTPGYLADALVAGVLAVFFGVLGLVATVLLYQQRWPWVAVIAAVGAIAMLGGVLLGPILGVVVLVLVYKAWQEQEFSSDVSGPRTVPRSQAKGA